VLHEIGHGLGFSSSMTLNDQNQGAWGLSNIPFVFDTYLRDNQNRALTDTLAFRNPSVQLRTALTNQNLFLDAPLPNRRNRNLPVRMYAPSPFERGSSISHLDFNTFNTSEDQLMVHAQTLGSSSLDPGPITMAIFTEMGWINTRLVHQPVVGNDRASVPVTIRARVVSDTALNLNALRVNLFYSTDRFQSSQVLAMQPTATRGEYQAVIPAATANRTVNYYIEAGLGGLSLTSPGGAPRNSWFFASLASDNTAPTIAHEPPRFLLETESNFAVVAEINDQLGVDTAFVEFQVNAEPLARVGMARELFTGFVIQGGSGGTSMGYNTSNGGSGSFAARLQLFNLRGGDVLRYRIVARDLAQGRNQSTSPATGFHEVRVVGFGEPRATYENNFNNIAAATGDFIGTDFRIEQPRGFENACLNSDHPYRDGSGANNESNYVYLLRFPITVRAENSFLRFDEIVLVEPGEAGAVFGDQEFWDYVIVEGSRDRGRNWLTLLEGYDSRNRPEWLTAYNQRISNNNSTTEGTPALFRSRQIDMGRIFRPGEQVVLRFRLFVDQSANGWGWAIDNLQIQTAALGLEDYLVSLDDVRVYPNPTEGGLQVSAQFKKAAKQLRVRVTDAIGRQVYADAQPTSGVALERSLDLKGLATGMYLVSLEIDGAALTKKVFVR
jgi:Secretion system C-terminal sorting domain